MDRQRQSSPSLQDASPGADQWYVLIRDQKYGPLHFDHLLKFARQSRLLQDDWVWKPGLDSWVAAAEVPGLFNGPDRDASMQPARGTNRATAQSQHKQELKARAKHQLKEFLLMFFYLWVVFGMLAVHESIVLAQHQIDFQLHGLAFINALIFAKVMLIAEDMHLGRRLEDQPLVYSIVFKSVLFAIALISFHIVEHVIFGVLHGRSMAQSIAEVGVNQLKGIVSLGIIGTVALVPFFILREISRVMGEDNFWALFFHRRSP